MIPLLPIVLLGLAYILLDEDEKPAKSNSKEEKGNESNRKTSSDNRSRNGRGVSSATSSKRRPGSVIATTDKTPPADSVETVGEEINQEDNDHASRQETTNTNDDSVQLGESGTETTQPGDAVSTSEAAS